MSAVKHTPGPWLYTQSGKCCYSIIKPDGHTIVHLTALENSTAASKLEANARLIAAAPRMSEALKRAAFLLAEIDQANSPQVLALRNEIIACIKEATPEHYGL